MEIMWRVIWSTRTQKVLMPFCMSRFDSPRNLDALLTEAGERNGIATKNDVGIDTGFRCVSQIYSVLVVMHHKGC